MKKRGMHGFWCKHGKEDKNKCGCHCGQCGGGVYFLGFIGSAVYYLQQAPTFWTGIVGLLKALVWPAFLVYKLLG
jgi:hypothetical protein